MKCAKCGAFISEGSTVCTGCNTLVSELEMNNLLIKENNMGGVPTEQPAQPVVVETAPVVEPTPVVEVQPVVEQSPVVETAPVVEVAPVAEVAPTEPVLENPVVETAPVVEVSPVAEVAPVVEPTPVVETAPVVEVTPVVNQEQTPVVEVQPVVETAPVVEPTPVVQSVPEVITPVNPVEVTDQPVTTLTPDTPSILDNPSASTPNEVVVGPVSETPVETAVPVAPTENNTIINSVVSEVETTATNDTTAPAGNAPVAEVKPEEAKGKGKVGLIIGIAVALLAVAAILGFVLLSSKTGTPEKMFKTTLGVVRNRLNSDKEIKPTKVTLTFQTNLSSQDAEMQAMYTKFNKLYLETSVYADLAKSITNMDLLLKYDGKNMFDVDVYSENTTAFVKLNGLYDKYIKTELTTEDSVETEQIVAFVDGYMQAIEKALKEEYFKESETTIKLNNEDVKVKANTLVINDKNISTIATNVINDLKANTKFVDAYAALNDMSKDDVLEELDITLSSFQNTADWTDEMKKSISFEITIYTKGMFNSPVGFGMVMPEGSYNVYFTEEYVVAYTMVDGKEIKFLDATMNNGKYNINYYIEDEVLSFILGYSIEENPTFTKPDTSNSVKYEELTENDMTNITMALMQNEGITAFMTDFADLIQMFQMMFGSGMLGDDMSGDMMGDDMYSDDMLMPEDTLMNENVGFEEITTESDDLVLE